MNCGLENIMQYMISITHWTSQLLVLSNFNEKKNHKLERDCENYMLTTNTIDEYLETVTFFRHFTQTRSYRKS